MPWSYRLAALCVLVRQAWSFSVLSDATWFQAQSQFMGNQSLLAFGSDRGPSQGVTRFPLSSAVTAPSDCTLGVHPGNSTDRSNDYNTSSYVARVKLSNGSYAWGFAAPYDVWGCDGDNPCSNSTSWGYFTINGSAYTAADVAQLPARVPLFSGLSSANTLFDILIQPAPEWGFSYQWRPLSSPASPNQTDMVIDGSAPCCVPVSPAAQASILAQYNISASGSRIGSCNLKTGQATVLFNVPDNATALFISVANASTSTQVLVMEQSAAAPSPPAPAPSQPSEPNKATFPYIFKGQDQPDDRLFSLVTENVTTYNQIPSWVPASFPGGCTSPLLASGYGYLSTSYPENICNPYGYDTPAWYLPGTTGSLQTPSNLSDWFVAFLQQNQTAGRRLPSEGTWSFGRAWLGQAQTWQAMFADGELEWNASRLVAPADFHVLGYNTSGKSGQGIWNASHTFTYGNVTFDPMDATPRPLPEYVQLSGAVPCCIDASVAPPTKDLGRPASDAPRTVRLGNVLGTCDMNSQMASFTWLGIVWQQNMTGSRLLTIDFHKKPDPKRNAKIAGGVVGGVVGFLVVVVTFMAVFAVLTFRTRARKRLLQDYVYNLVMGIRPDDFHPAEIVHADSEVQGALSMDRFYNLLPFVNRMPHNRFYASLSSKVAGKCVNAHFPDGSIAVKQAAGPTTEDMEGHIAQALAFGIMRYESTWATTDKALVQQWRAGRKGRRHVVHSVLDILQGPELGAFLEGLDGENEAPEKLTSSGWLTTLARVLFWRLPDHRVRYKITEPVAQADTRIDGELGPGELGFKMPRLTSLAFDGSAESTVPSTDSSKPSLGLTDALHILKLDAYEIKPGEIEIMKNLDGSPAVLGKGAFGEVCKAKYNSVQVVAVKQLREEGLDAKARVDFLREVAIMKRLHAENIVRFLGVCVQDSRTMLVTEYMQGGDLFNRLSVAEPGGELAWHNAGRRIAADIARGLAFLHSQQIVHFDLKSPNVLLARDNTAKIADVGLARFMHNDQITQMTVMGTMAWAAPEVLRGTKDCISTKVDIYSFGVLLWEIVTGISPRFGVAWFRPPRVPEECPAWVAELITSCMLENPAARPTSKEIYRMLLEGSEELA